MAWKVEKRRKKDFDNSILIEGLPGIGNVGKLAADLLVQEFDSEVVAEFHSHSLPNAVFVREDNLVELPRVEVKHFEHDGKDFLFLVGDAQPTDAEPSYEFAEAVLDYLESQGCAEAITLGGIGLQNMQDEPDVYCTANDEELLEELSGQGANKNTHGKVGPIMGITGLLLGLGEERGIRAASLLGETLAHPMYIGLRGAKRVINVLNERYGFGVSTDDLDKEIEDMEEQLKQSMSNLQQTRSTEGKPEMSYIG